MEAHPAVAPNWFWISFGKNVDTPEVPKPSAVPANVMNMNAGFFMRFQKDLGRSLRDLVATSFSGEDLLSVWVWDTRVARMWAAAVVNNVYIDKLSTCMSITSTNSNFNLSQTSILYLIHHASFILIVILQL